MIEVVMYILAGLVFFGLVVAGFLTAAYAILGALALTATIMTNEYD